MLTPRLFASRLTFWSSPLVERTFHTGPAGSPPSSRGRPLAMVTASSSVAAPIAANSAARAPVR